MIKQLFNAVKLCLANYTEQERQILAIKSCMSKQIEFNSPLLKSKEYRFNLLHKDKCSQPLGDYNYNRDAMKKLIKRLADNGLIQKCV